MRKSNTESLRDVLRQHQKENKHIDKKLIELQIARDWEKIMGRVIAKYTISVHIANDTLFIKLKSPMLKNELILQRELMLEKINACAGRIIVSKVAFL